MSQPVGGFGWLVFGLLFGLLFGGLACLRHLALRGLLVYNGFAPLRYIRFLDEATERLFLRRAGSSYIFVHRLLLEHFAELHTTPSPRRGEATGGPSTVAVSAPTSSGG